MKRNCLLILTLSVLNLSMIAQVPDNENFVVTHGPYLQNLDGKGVTIIWTTNKPAIPGVKMTAPDGKTWFVRNSRDGIVDGGGLLHKVRIDGLEPGTSYKYSINSVQILKYQAYKVYYGDTSGQENREFFNISPEKGSDRFSCYK
ncbi:MAG: fibronectin type III domain-containing protein [Marinilabiliales bacterium]|nr:fibronectin type III domain-containing protein [Marinilabiliales bacterium]